MSEDKLLPLNGDSKYEFRMFVKPKQFKEG